MTKPEDDIWFCDIDYLEKESRKLHRTPTKKQVEDFCNRSWQLIREYNYNPTDARQQAFNEIIR